MNTSKISENSSIDSKIQNNEKLKQFSLKDSPQLIIPLSPNKGYQRKGNMNHSFQKGNFNNHEDISLKELNSTTSKKMSIIQQKTILDKLQWEKLDEIIKRIKFKTYIKKFLMQSRIRLFRLLNFQQSKIINDQAYYFASWDKQGKGLRINGKARCNECVPKIIRKSFANFPIFQPNNPILEVWQGLKIISVIVCFYFYLVGFAFNLPIDSLLKIELNFACQICLAIDILVNLNTAIYLKGQLTTSRKQILHQYRASNSLYCDTIQLTSFIIYTLLYVAGYKSSRSIQALLLPIILKHNDLNIIIKKMKNKFLLQKETQNAIELVNLLKNIFLISHIFACIWILSAKMSQDLEYNAQYTEKNGNVSGDNTWLTLMNIENDSWVVQYLYSYYFITVTMITVGYGDVRPTNPLEVGVCIFLMMTCCLIFGFTLNSIGEIFQDIFSKEKNILQKRCIIANYMHRKDINPSTQKSVFEYLEYYWREELDENIEETQKILKQLSSNLNQELLLESNILILKNNKILKENFNKEVLIRCLPYIQEQNCTPGEIIIDERAGNIDCYLYFVQQGEIEVFYNCARAQAIEVNAIKRMKKGNNFGQRSFFTGEKDSLSVKSINFSTLLKLKRSDFISILIQYQQEYETFSMIKDRILYSGYNFQLYESCSSCGDSAHTEISCPIVHFIPKKLKIIQQNQMSTPHLERGTAFTRRLEPKKNTYYYLEYNLIKFYQFIEEKQSIIDDYEIGNFEYSFFKNNQSYNDLDEISEKEHHLPSFQNRPSTEKLFTGLQLKESSSELQQNDKKAKKLSFHQKFSQHKITQQPYNQKSLDLEERDEASSKNILQSQNTEIDVDKDISSTITQNRLSFSKAIQKEVKQRKRIMTAVGQQNQIHTSSQNIQINNDQDQHYETGSPKNQEKNYQVNRLSLFQPQQASCKDINVIELAHKIQKQQEFSSYLSLKNHSVQLKSSTEANHIIEFDLLHGQFDKLFTFKNYFPHFNYKQIISQLNDYSYQYRNGKLIKQSQNKKENIKNQRMRRNGKKLSIGIKFSNNSKINNKYLNSPNKQFDQFSIKSCKNISLSSQYKTASKETQQQNQNLAFNFDIKDQSTFQEEIKVELETPRVNEEQVHLRKQPTVTQPKKSYLTNRNSDTCDTSYQLDNTLIQQKCNFQSRFSLLTKELE